MVRCLLTPIELVRLFWALWMDSRNDENEEKG